MGEDLVDLREALLADLLHFFLVEDLLRVEGQRGDGVQLVVDPLVEVRKSRVELVEQEVLHELLLVTVALLGGQFFLLLDERTEHVRLQVFQQLVEFLRRLDAHRRFFETHLGLL